MFTFCLDTFLLLQPLVTLANLTDFDIAFQFVFKSKQLPSNFNVFAVRHMQEVLSQNQK